MTLPLIHCFDHNYVLPAAVCFHSLLEHARRKDVSYVIEVLGSGLTQEDSELLETVVSRFPNARLNIRSLPSLSRFQDGIRTRSHYSTELYRKLALPSLFEEYRTAVVADVDVIYEDDVASVLDELPRDDDWMVAGVWDLGYAAAHGCGLFPTGRPFIRGYARKYTQAEREALRIGAGLMVYNLDRLRKEGIQAKWESFALKNLKRAILPEQETINLTVPDRIRLLPMRYMAITQHLPQFGRMTTEDRRRNPAWDEMFAHIVQLHYASVTKPWSDPGSAGADRWFAACARAGLVETWRRWFAEYNRPAVEWRERRKIVDLSFRLFSRAYELSLTKGPKSASPAK